MTCQGIWHPKVLLKRPLQSSTELQITIFSLYPFSIKISPNLLTQRSDVNLSTFSFSEKPQKPVKTFKLFTSSEIKSQELAGVASQAVIATQGNIQTPINMCIQLMMPHN